MCTHQSHTYFAAVHPGSVDGPDDSNHRWVVQPLFKNQTFMAYALRLEDEEQAEIGMRSDASGSGSSRLMLAINGETLDFEYVSNKLLRVAADANPAAAAASVNEIRYLVLMARGQDTFSALEWFAGVVDSMLDEMTSGDWVLPDAGEDATIPTFGVVCAAVMAELDQNAREITMADWMKRHIVNTRMDEDYNPPTTWLIVVYLFTCAGYMADALVRGGDELELWTRQTACDSPYLFMDSDESPFKVGTKDALRHLVDRVRLAIQDIQAEVDSVEYDPAERRNRVRNVVFTWCAYNSGTSIGGPPLFELLMHNYIQCAQWFGTDTWAHDTPVYNAIDQIQETTHLRETFLFFNPGTLIPLELDFEAIR